MIDILDLIKDRMMQYKIWLIVIGVVFVGGVLCLYLKSAKPASNTPAIQSANTHHANSTVSATSTAVSSESVVIMVDIKGAVKNPGVYDIANSPRVQTAVAKAGGITNEADTVKLNLAQKLTDGQMIYVPTRGEVTTDMAVDNKDRMAPNDSEKVNLNTATLTELQTLAGIGEKKAEQIISYREAHGGFKNIDEIKEVSGIGDKRFETIQDNVTI
ncbi:helix-hairpin-helix domain-containing protein [Leuconostoc rapi]|uniref:helix-hairpin-helix domain-containing protein n=1 Tax=Leuconostoc rapi TaxID=1406906 RepID=UPI001956FC73|nr:helix-hairpin-helix domain-containing protein [Leuconostoc rapi]MBM7435406.1 competence protein ComEA [Leuconostoc rapi]